jgi:hypothetical protein
MWGSGRLFKRTTWAISVAALLLFGGLGALTEGPPAAAGAAPAAPSPAASALSNLSALSPIMLAELRAAGVVLPACFIACLANPFAYVAAALAGIAVASVCLGAGAFVAEGGGSIAMGCVYLGILTAGGLAAYFTVLANEGTVSEPDLYYPAEAQASTLLGSLRDQVNQVGATIANVANLTDDLTGLYGYETAAAAGAQLPNSSFNLAENLVQSGVASQMLGVLDGAAFNLAGPVEGFWTSWNNCFGTTGQCGVNHNYGSDGYVCEAAANVSAWLTGSGTVHVEGKHAFLSGPDPNASISAPWGPDGECVDGGTGVRITLATNSTATDASQTDAGIIIPTPDNATGTGPIQVYVGANSTLLFGDVSSENGNGESGASPCPPAIPHCYLPAQPRPAYEFNNFNGTLNFSGPYPSAISHSVLVHEGDVKATGLAPGLYNLTGSETCVTTNCSVTNQNRSYWLATGILPLYLNSNATNGFLENSTGLGAFADGQLLYDCEESTTQLETSGAYSGVVPIIDWASNSGNLTPVSLCPVGSLGIIPAVESEMEGAAIIGEGYWSTLHGLGVYLETTIPADCAIPTPADFLPPDTPLGQIIRFGAHDIANLLLAYLTTLASTYGLSPPAFCGYHIPPPGNVTLNDPNWALVGDIFTHTGGQTLGTLASWYAVGEGMDVLPKNGNYTIPVNATYEVSATNPAEVFYGPTDPSPAHLNKSNVANATIDLTYGGVIPNLVGNSTLRQGSAWPNDTDSRLGAGDALHLTQCWHNSSGVWKQVSTCDLDVIVVSYIQPNGSGSCYFEGSCNGSGGTVFPQPWTVTCGFFLATDFAQPFKTLSLGPFNLSSLACVLGWIFVAVIFGVIAYVAIAIIRNVARGRSG